MAEEAERTEPAVSSKFLVTGLDCADCAAKVEKAVKRIPGVISATIAFPAGRLDVDYDPQQTGITQVIDKVKKLIAGQQQKFCQQLKKWVIQGKWTRIFR